MVSVQLVDPFCVTIISMTAKGLSSGDGDYLVCMVCTWSDGNIHCAAIKHPSVYGGMEGGELSSGLSINWTKIKVKLNVCLLQLHGEWSDMHEQVSWLIHLKSPSKYDSQGFIIINTDINSMYCILLTSWHQDPAQQTPTMRTNKYHLPRQQHKIFKRFKTFKLIREIQM